MPAAFYVDHAGNQVGGTDITYTQMPRGFAYLVAIMDRASHKTLFWKLTNMFHPSSCVEALEEAIAKYAFLLLGVEIFLYAVRS